MKLAVLSQKKWRRFLVVLMSLFGTMFLYNNCSSGFNSNVVEADAPSESLSQNCTDARFGLSVAIGESLSFYPLSSGSAAQCQLQNFECTTEGFSPALPANYYQTCLVAGQTCPSSSVAGVVQSVPAGNMENSTVTGYPSSLVNFGSTCAQVTSTCQSSGSWSGAYPLYASCATRCLNPDNGSFVNPGTVFRDFYTRSEAPTSAECQAALFSQSRGNASVCSGATGLFSPSIPATIYSSCRVVSDGGGSEGQIVSGRLTWSSGFENGVPGEWLNYITNFSADGSLPNGAMGWTVVNRSSGEPVFSGNYAYRGRVQGRYNSPDGTRRAYPVRTDDLPTPMVSTFMIYLDVNYNQMNTNDWISIATYSNNPDKINWPDIHGLSVVNRRLEMAHMEVPGFSGQYVGPSPQPEFPVRRWVRMTVYIHYQSNRDGIVHVWQDGVRVFTGIQRSQSASTMATVMHWGIYTNNADFNATLYNDELSIWHLDQPLSQFDREPIVR